MIDVDNTYVVRSLLKQCELLSHICIYIFFINVCYPGLLSDTIDKGPTSLGRSAWHALSDTKKYMLPVR